MALPLGFTGARLDRADQVRVDAERFAAVVADPRALCLALDGIDFVPGEGGGLHWEPFDPADTRAPMLLGIDEAGVPHFVREPAPGQRLEIGRASCRDRVCQYVRISVVAGTLKNKTK